jgi:hypothetical protein
MNIITNIKTFCRYLITLFFHKFIVFVAGLYVNWKLRSTGYFVSLKRLIWHDMSKFTLAELWPYAQHYYGNKEKDGFDYAWEHHWNCNDHHAEYWKQNRMPDEAVVEMVCDWYAADLAYSGRWPPFCETWQYLHKNLDRYMLKLHPQSFYIFCGVLVALGHRLPELQFKFHWSDGDKLFQNDPVALQKWRSLQGLQQKSKHY